MGVRSYVDYIDSFNSAKPDIFPGRGQLITLTQCFTLLVMLQIPETEIEMNSSGKPKIEQKQE